MSSCVYVQCMYTCYDSLPNIEERVYGETPQLHHMWGKETMKQTS